MTENTRDNVQVCCRFRPENELEKKQRGAGDQKFLQFQSNKTAIQVAHEEKNHNFAFDYVLPPGADQVEVFNHSAAPLIAEIFKGFNATIFAYGQTGSGKTYTMMGDMDDPNEKGIIPRLITELFKRMESASENLEFTVKVSYVEIYMEKLHDLLDVRKGNLTIREAPGKGVYIEDATEVYVSSVDEVIHWMKEGGENRAMAATRMNATSSRSHSVLSLTLSQKDRTTGTKKHSKLILVDLAGSEKVNKTEAAGKTLKEAQHINKSLTLLGNVIHALTENSQHIPYRDSKLTRLLTDSLGGNSRTTLIVTASPSLYNLEETVSTLRFGVRAKAIKNRAVVNQELGVEEYKRLLEIANRTIADQKLVIEKLKADLTAITKGTYVFPTMAEVPQELRADQDVALQKAQEREAEVLQVVEEANVELESLRKQVVDMKKKSESDDEEISEMSATVEEQAIKLSEMVKMVEEVKRQMLSSKAVEQEMDTLRLDLTRVKEEQVIREQQLNVQKMELFRASEKAQKDYMEKCSEVIALRMELEEVQAGNVAQKGKGPMGIMGGMPKSPASGAGAGNHKRRGSMEKATDFMKNVLSGGMDSKIKQLDTDNITLKAKVDEQAKLLEIENEKLNLMHESIAKVNQVHHQHVKENKAQMELLQQELARYKAQLEKFYFNPAQERAGRIRRQSIMGAGAVAASSPTSAASAGSTSGGLGGLGGPASPTHSRGPGSTDGTGVSDPLGGYRINRGHRGSIVTKIVGKTLNPKPAEES